jgi:hypothetical protein
LIARTFSPVSRANCNLVVAVAVVVFSFIAARLVAAPLEVQVNTLDGRAINGTLESMSSDSVALKSGDSAVTVKSSDLHSLVPKSPGEDSAKKPTAWVDLVDGSRLPVESFSVQDGKATITLLDGAVLGLTTRQVRWVRYSKLDEPDAELAQTEAAGDLLGVKKRDSVDYLEGVIGDVSKEAVHFTIGGEVLPVNPSKVDSLVFAARPAAGDGPAAACVVEETTGASLLAKTIELKDGTVHLSLLGGGSVERPLEVIRRLDFSAGKLTYLSDLKPQSVQWTPFFDLGKQSPALAKFLGPRFDRGREHETMRLGGQEYKKGISLTSRTEIVFKVPSQARRFRAIAGIDDGVADLGSVQLIVSGDGRPLYSGKLTGKDPPAELDLDLAGVRRLSIVVDFGDDLDVGDHLNLCEARIVK